VHFGFGPEHSELRNEKMVVYHVNNACAIDFVSGKQSVFLMCETLQADPRKVDFHLKENRVRNMASGLQCLQAFQ
jgi:hypothetical protein